ncbi:MAG: hypothetical protein FJX77_05350 [Armatimonadetes bacterium]|nr:hypothetical protein [Armatimonadota bacterium]
MAAYWELQLFGTLTVAGQGRRIHRFRTEKTACLLAYLALSLGKARSREFLAELLWPDEEPEAARHGLRTYLDQREE